MRKKSQFTKIMHYIGWKGDSTFIKDGTRPLCAHCFSKKMDGVVELVQQGFDGDKVWLVMRCQKCMNTTIYDYEIMHMSDDDVEKEIEAHEAQDGCKGDTGIVG